MPSICSSDHFVLSSSLFKNINLDKWLEEETPWPVSFKDYQEYYYRVRDLYFEYSDESKDFHELTSILNRLFFVDYLQFLHSYMVVSHLQDKGIKYSFDKEDYYYCFLSGNSQSCKDLRSLYLENIPSFPRRLKGILKVFVKNIILNEHSVFNSNSILTLSRPRDEFLGYGKEEKRPFKVLYPFPIFIKNKRIPERLKEFSRKLVGRIKVFMSELGYPLSEIVVAYLEDLTFECYSKTFSMHEAIKQKMKAAETKTFIANALGDSITRSMSIVVKSQSGSTIGGSHGHNYGLVKDSSCIYRELPMVNEYLTYGAAAREIVKQGISECMITQNSSVKVQSRDSVDFYNSLYEKNSFSKPREIKKILLVESLNYWGRYPWHHDSFWYHRVRWRIKVATYLRSLGYHVSIKLNPSNTKLTEGIYEQYFDEVKYNDFEMSIKETDALLYLNISTTTFGYALASNIPIIIFDCILEDVYPQITEKLRKRCIVVPSKVKDNDVIEFDRKFLKSELENPTVDFSNREYLDNFLCR